MTPFVSRHLGINNKVSDSRDIRAKTQVINQKRLAAVLQVLFRMFCGMQRG